MRVGYFATIGLFWLAAILWIVSVSIAVFAYPKRDALWFAGLFGGLAILSALGGVILHIYLEYHPETEPRQPFMVVVNGEN